MCGNVACLWRLLRFSCVLRVRGRLVLLSFLISLDAEGGFNVSGLFADDECGGFHVAFARFTLFRKNVVTESAFADDLAAAGDFYSFCCPFVGL